MTTLITQMSKPAAALDFLHIYSLQNTGFPKNSGVLSALIVFGSIFDTS